METKKKHTVGLEGFRRDLTRYVRAASERGERTILTEHGKPVAELRPFSGSYVFGSGVEGLSRGVAEYVAWQCACLYAMNTGERCARYNRLPEQSWAEGLEDPDVDQEKLPE